MVADTATRLQGHVLPVYQYAVNRDDVLIWVSKSWRAFARENDAPELADRSLRGVSLWVFIGDRETRGYYQRLHDGVRESKLPVTISSRCDSPTLRRDLRISLRPMRNGGILYESLVASVNVVPELALLSRNVRRSRQRLTLCSNCKKALIEPLGWLDLAAAGEHLPLYEKGFAPRLAYSMCPGCLALPIACAVSKN